MDYVDGVVTVSSLESIDMAHRLALEEVVVTAQRRAQSLQDVPVVVSALMNSASG